MKWLWDNILPQTKEVLAEHIVVVSIMSVSILTWFCITYFYHPSFPQIENSTFERIQYTSISEKVDEKEEWKEKPKIKNEIYSSVKSQIADSSKKEVIPKKRPKKKKAFYKKEIKTSEPFYFDPNTITKDSLQLLGMSERVASNLIKFRESGTVFYNEEKLEKIYGLETELYQKLKPFIRIKKEEKPPSIEKPKWKPKPPPQIIDINKADTTQWKTLPGIGPFYSKMITRFRSKLGGFYAVSQIKDCWGLPDSVYVKIQPYLMVNSDYITKQNINTLSNDELKKHPYIDWKKAKLILAYKKMHGEFKTLEDVENIAVISPAYLDTLRYYYDVR